MKQKNLIHLIEFTDLLNIDPAQEIDPQSIQEMQNRIKCAISVLCEALSAMSLDLSVNPSPTNEYVTPELVSEFAALIGELIPLFNQLSRNLQHSHSKQS